MKLPIVNDTALLDATLIPSWIYCPETLRFLYVNKATVATYGYSRDDFAGMTLKDIRPEEDIQALLNDINNGVRTRITQPQTSRWRHRRKDGSLFYVEMFASYIEYSDRPARLVQAINIDDKVRELQQADALNRVLCEQKGDLDYLLGSITEVVWIANADTAEMIYINNACERVHGYTAAEMMADHTLFFNSIHPDDMPSFIQSGQRMMDTGFDEREFRVVHRDGTIRHLKGTAVLRKGINGGSDICCGLTMDITDLKKEQQRTENILNSITDGFFVLDKDWKFTYINQAFKKMYGSKADVLGKTYWEVFPNAKDQKFFTEYSQARSQSSSVHFEEYASSLGRWVMVSAYPMSGGLAVYFTDIHEEKELKDALIRQDSNLQALINNTDDLIWSIDKNLKILSVNKACQEYILAATGRKLAPGQPTAIHDMPAEMQQRWQENYRRAFSGELFKVTDQYTGPDGDLQYWETSFYHIRDAGGNITGVSCFCANITTVYKHTRDIEMQNLRLKEIAQAQSHQVRGPVATIMGLQQLFNPGDPGHPINREVLEGIQTASEILDTMIRSIDQKTRAAVV